MLVLNPVLLLKSLATVSRVSLASFVFIRSQQTHALISRKPDLFCPFLVQSSLVHLAALNGCKHMGWLYMSAQNNRDIFQTEIHAWISFSQDSPPSFQQLTERCFLLYCHFTLTLGSFLSVGLWLCVELQLAVQRGHYTKTL